MVQSYGMVHTCTDGISLGTPRMPDPRLGQTAHHVAWKSMTESLLLSFDKIPFSWESEVICVIVMLAKTICTQWARDERDKMHLAVSGKQAWHARTQAPAGLPRFT